MRSLILMEQVTRETEITHKIVFNTHTLRAGDFNVDAFAEKYKDDAGIEAYKAFKQKLLLISSNCKSYNADDGEYCRKADAFQQKADAVCEEKWEGVIKAVFDMNI